MQNGARARLWRAEGDNMTNARWTLVMAAAALALAGCSSEHDEGDPATAATHSASPAPTAADESAMPSPTPEATPSPEAHVASFVDLNGRWCDEDPSASAQPCVNIDLPVLVFDGYAEEYTYLPGKGSEVDPRTYVPADLALAPTKGDCWDMAIDGYPAMSGAWLTYCPAGAVSGEQWIDDPWTYFAELWGEDTSDLPDYRDQDRLYMGQEMLMYPFVRSSS